MKDLKIIDLRREKSDHHEIDTGALHQRKKKGKSEDDRLPLMPATLSCLTRDPNTTSKSVETFAVFLAALAIFATQIRSSHCEPPTTNLAVLVVGPM